MILALSFDILGTKLRGTAVGELYGSRAEHFREFWLGGVGAGVVFTIRKPFTIWQRLSCRCSCYVLPGFGLVR